MKELDEHQLKALEKLEQELKKDIALAVSIAKHSKFFDLLYFIYGFKTLRLNDIIAEEENRNTSFMKTTTHVYEDVAKYIIQLVAKYGTMEMAMDKTTGMPHVNFSVTDALNKQCIYINSKYESQSLIQLFGVELQDKEAKKLKIDMTNIQSDEDTKKFFDYFLRIDRDNDIKKALVQKKEELIQNFKNEYEPVKDLFIEAHGISIDEYCEFILWILNESQEEILKAKDKFDYLDNGNVNDQSLITMLAFIPSFLFMEKELKEKFGDKYDKIITLMTFDKDKYNEQELRFHLITRSPFIKIMDGYLISPELLLDSLFTNIHYSFLESPSVKEEYKARQATFFIDKLVEIARQYGFTEVSREYDLFENSNQIGDIDLTLKDDKNNYILIEAKNHALILDVYFKDLLKTREHLNMLKSTWEKKVLKRVEHLKVNHEKYSIPSTYKYIVVSRFPEIISHYSELLVLSTNEFDYWLKMGRLSDEFKVITESFYKVHEKNYSPEDLESLAKSGLIFGKFSK